jgi:hypothetical protein
MSDESPADLARSNYGPASFGGKSMSKRIKRARTVIFSDAISKDVINAVLSKGLAKRPTCELDMPVWAVISTRRPPGSDRMTLGVEASQITYSEGELVIADLRAAKIPGLSIVTQATADRIGNPDASTEEAITDREFKKAA